VGKVYPLLPKLTVNRQFMGEFFAADAPCFALGMVEERKRRCGFLALRPEEAIPPDVTSAGFSLGHCLFGNPAFEVVQFSFHFYGFKMYNVLVNPNNPIAQTVHCRGFRTGGFSFGEQTWVQSGSVSGSGRNPLGRLGVYLSFTVVTSE
jgi:hypothetical protein